MQGTCAVSFVIESLSGDEPVPSILPVVNGVRLTDLVAEFERASQYEPAGGYAGLVPRFFRLGRLDEYFMGVSTDPAFLDRGYWLLGWECGEAGCWPLEARMIRSDRQISWEHCRQPFRHERDYSSFGPFRFDFEQYRGSVCDLASTISPGVITSLAGQGQTGREPGTAPLQSPYR